MRVVMYLRSAVSSLAVGVTQVRVGGGGVVCDSRLARPTPTPEVGIGHIRSAKTISHCIASCGSSTPLQKVARWHFAIHTHTPRGVTAFYTYIVYLSHTHARGERYNTRTLLARSPSLFLMHMHFRFHLLLSSLVLL